MASHSVGPAAEASRERFHAEAEFYFELEKRFFSAMRELLKDELDVKPLVIGTAVAVGAIVRHMRQRRPPGSIR